MFDRDREESIESLSDMYSKKQMKKAITQGYSDVSLAVMAHFKKEYSEKIINSLFSAQTINKICGAYAEGKIDNNDLFMSVTYSSSRNEPYVDDFINSIDEGVYHSTAARIFAAVNYEDCTYSEALDYVKSGAFYPTDYGSLSVTNETAEQLDKMGVPLRVCEGFNYCYDLYDLQEALDINAAIFVKDKDLAVKVNELMKLPDWEDFRNEVVINAGESIVNLSGERLESWHDDFVTEKNSVLLHEKMKAEHEAFLDGLRSGTVDNAINSAYEITTKSDIMLYSEYNVPRLTDEQYKALMTSPDALHEIYEEWRNGDYLGFSEIETAMRNTADKIQISVDRNREEKISAVMENNVPEQKQEQTVKPKHKSR